MLKNYLLSSLRNIRKHSFYSFINIAGLSVGLACVILIALFIQDELSFDKHHEKGDRIVRYWAEIKFGGNEMKIPVGPAPLKDALVADFPEVETSCHMRGRGSYLVKRETDNFKEQDVIWASNEVFDVFTIPIIKGDAKTPLVNPDAIAISESAAEKYFGQEDPIGKILTLDNELEVEVTAVYEDMPKNSHFNFDFLIAMEGLEESKNGIWLSHNFYTYMVMEEGSSYQDLEAKFPEMLEKYAGPQILQFTGESYDEFQESGQFVKYHLQPLEDIYLKSDFGFEIGRTGDIKYVYIFTAIAVFILVIAVINFMNLSTARSANRAKEVGVRKVMGSKRSGLVNQFLTESILLTLFSTLIAIAFAAIILPYFNTLSSKEMVLPVSNVSFWLILVGLILVVGTLAGIYPAFYLSSFQPAQVLKGKLKQGAKSGWLRSTLVVFQFATSIVLIIGTMVVSNQLNYIQNKKLGFNKEQVVILNDAYALDDNVQYMKNEMLRHPQVVSATISGFLPVPSNRSDNAWWPEGETNMNLAVSQQSWVVDFDYIKTMGIEIIAGRDFNPENPADSSAVILNERAAKLYGFENPIGERIQTATGFPDEEGNFPMATFEIIGIVKDFHYQSLRENIDALGFTIGNSRSLISFKVNSDNISGFLEDLEAKYKELAPGMPFEVSFMDERFSNVYRTEQRIGRVYGVFSGLAILIACLGLFGLAAFTTEQRTKEIGIRKVMGASVPGIVFLISKDFGKLIIVAFIIAAPAGWLFMNNWLKDFEFKVDLKPWIFIAAGILAFLIAMITMSYQSIKAARANPVNSLRNE